MTYDTSGKLWNKITRANASKVCQNMYVNDSSVGVESDLTNSYAWDTAIVFIQEMGNSNYANATSKTTGNYKILKNTGETGDKVCNIFDMAANLQEWTTEYSDESSPADIYPCIYRGGAYNSNLCTADRDYDSGGSDGNSVKTGSRSILYVK